MGWGQSSPMRTGIVLDALKEAFFAEPAGIQAAVHWKLEMRLRKLLESTFKLSSRLYNDHQQPIKVLDSQAGIQQG